MPTKTRRRPASPFAKQPYPAGGWKWLRSPVNLAQIFLLLALVAAGLALTAGSAAGV